MQHWTCIRSHENKQAHMSRVPHSLCCNFRSLIHKSDTRPLFKVTSSSYRLYYSIWMLIVSILKTSVCCKSKKVEFMVKIVWSLCFGLTIPGLYWSYHCRKEKRTKLYRSTRISLLVWYSEWFHYAKVLPSIL